VNPSEDVVNEMLGLDNDYAFSGGAQAPSAATRG
jgi:hypothetical protein